MLQIRDFDANAASLLGTRDGMGFYSPQPVRVQTPPPVLRGNFMDHDAELPEDGSVSGSWATVFMQDVYHGLEPHVKRGEIKQIAVVQEVEKSTHSPFTNKRPDGLGMRAVPVFGFQFPLVSCGATYAPKKVWVSGRSWPRTAYAVFRVPSEVPNSLPGPRRRGPSGAADADLYPLHAGRGPPRRLPRRPQLDRTCADIQRITSAAAPGTSHSGVGRQGIQLPGGRPGRVRPALRRVSQRIREQPGNADLTGDLTDFFNVSDHVLCRTGTQGANHWQSHGSPSGAEYDKVAAG